MVHFDKRTGHTTHLNRIGSSKIRIYMIVLFAEVVAGCVSYWMIHIGD